MNHLLIGVNNKLNILSLSLLGGLSGRFLGGLVAWNVFNLENNKTTVNLECIEKPGKIVMYLFDEDKQWSDRYEKTI